MQECHYVTSDDFLCKILAKIEHDSRRPFHSLEMLADLVGDNGLSGNALSAEVAVIKQAIAPVQTLFSQTIIALGPMGNDQRDTSEILSQIVSTCARFGLSDADKVLLLQHSSISDACSHLAGGTSLLSLVDLLLGQSTDSSAASGGLPIAKLSVEGAVPNVLLKLKFSHTAPVVAKISHFILNPKIPSADIILPLLTLRRLLQYGHRVFLSPHDDGYTLTFHLETDALPQHFS